MGHTAHNVYISKPLAHTRCLPPARYSRNPGFIREGHTSPVCQWPLKVSICPVNSEMTLNCSRVKTLARMTSTQISFPETVSDSLFRNSLVVQIQFHQLSGWLVSDDPCWWKSQMWRSRAGVVTYGLRLWGRLDVLTNVLKQRWRQFMVEKLTLNSLATALVDIPKITRSLNLRALWHCVVWQNCTF